MADLRIVDAPEIPTENITGEEKLPTGGSGNYSITLDSVADYTKTKKDLAGNASVDSKVGGVRQDLNTHIGDLLNPHQVTKGQIGLGNVDNTADADKPVSNSAQAAIISAVAPKADKTYVDTSLDLAKRGIANRYDSSLTYNSGERVVLFNGDIVKSTVANNIVDPNLDMTGWFLIGSNTIKTVESIADLIAIQNPKDGQTVFANSYRDGLNAGGGTFVYRGAKSSINDGVVTFYGWSRASFMFVTSKMAGCYADGIHDDTEAFQRGMDYCGANKIPFYGDDGVHLFNTANFFRWGSENQYQTNCQILDLKYNDLKIIAKSKNSILKLGDGITYTGWVEVGYVGARLFSTRSPNDAVSGFELIGFMLDGNGLNNKIRGINGGGTAAGNQAVFIWHGNNNHIKDCVFKDFSGYQVINISYDAYDTVVEGNEFINSGWLDGTNWTPNYTDQSTVYLGGTYVNRNNKFIQEVGGMFAGTAFELHGQGSTSGNYIENYANCFLSAAVVANAKNVFIANTCENCTMLLNTDTQNQLTNNIELIGNLFKQNTMDLSGKGIYGEYRSVIYAYAAYNPLNTTLIITGNTITTDGDYSGSTDAYLKANNSLLLLQQTNLVVFKGNTVKGFKGSVARLLRQADNSELCLDDNTYESCGVDGTFTHGNSVVYYDNDGAQDYGLYPAIIKLSKNTYSNCTYKSFYSANIDVAGSVVTPDKFIVDDDSSQNWIAPVLLRGDVQIRYNTAFIFNYKCYEPAILPELNPYEGGYNAVNVVGDVIAWNDKARVQYRKKYLDYIFTELV